MATSVLDKYGDIQTTTKGILHTFVDHLQRKYGAISVDLESVTKMDKAGHKTVPTVWRDLLDSPISMEELKTAVNKGAGKKAPGRDGICLEFFKLSWVTIKDDMLALFNQIYRDDKILDQQKRGTVVCVPKTHGPSIPADYRPITLRNTEYISLSRIIANRLRPLTRTVTPEPVLWVTGSTIFDAVATVRDAMAHAEVTQDPLCILSLDFKEASDKISHTCLFRMMRSCGFCERFITLIRQMYDQATSSVQINGHLTGPIPIPCSVRQRCPMSMLLFALSLNPMLHVLEQNLTGIRISRLSRKTAVVACADYNVIFVTTPEDIPAIKDAVRSYERARGAM
jgi:hypothetical protein